MAPGAVCSDFAGIFQEFSTAPGKISKQALFKVLQRLDASWTKERVEALAFGFGAQDVDIDNFLLWILYPEPSPAEYPVKCRSSAQRAKFIEERWEPFREEMQALLQRTQERAERGFALQEIMPSQATLRSMVDKCRGLTEEWHGRANFSYVYEMFMRMAERDGHSRYLFQDIPQERSEDGFVRVIDGEARARHYISKRTKNVVSEALVGRMEQSAGESPIDNLQLPTLMTREDALLLTAGRRIQQFFLWALRWKQRRILQRISLDRLQGEGLAAELLQRHGAVLESYGQVPPEVRAKAEHFIAESLRRSAVEVEEELKDFLQHCQKSPGRSYKANRVQHKLLLLKVLRSPAIRVLWRSEVEIFTQHRYISVPWRRRVPLHYLSEEGTFILLRDAGAEECSRFRKNVFAYAESHGLGQSGGGWTDDSRWSPGSLMYELGPLLCVDEAAKLPNHFVTDIEKIVQDCVLLSPDGTADALPGEVLHDAGQNPIIASSIGKTQHTQVSKACVEDFPLMMQQQSPRWCSQLGAFLDIVQVGTSEDAFFVSARTRRPDAEPLLRFFVELRLEYLRSFGRDVDFNCSCHPSVTGEYYLNLAPLARMKKIKVPPGQGVLGADFDIQNFDLGETVTTSNLPVGTVDSSQGKGNLHAMSPALWTECLAGRPLLTRLYDFNRKPGSLPIARRMIQKLF